MLMADEVNTSGGCMKTIIVNEEIKEGLKKIKYGCIGWKNSEWGEIIL